MIVLILTSSFTLQSSYFRGIADFITAAHLCPYLRKSDRILVLLISCQLLYFPSSLLLIDFFPPTRMVNIRSDVFHPYPAKLIRSDSFTALGQTGQATPILRPASTGSPALAQSRQIPRSTSTLPARIIQVSFPDLET